MRYPWAAAGPGRTTSRRAEHTSATQRRRCGGRRRVRRARLRCPWAAAGPGRTTSRRAKPHASTPGLTGVEGAGGTGGPGCGARGQQGLARQHTDTPTDWRPPRGLRGLAGLRADAPSEARGADGERAGRPRGGRRSVGATSTPYTPSRHNKTARPQWGRAAVAVALGFEPRVAVTPHSISSAAPSAARTRYLTRILYYTLPPSAQIDRAGWEQGHTAVRKQSHTAVRKQGHSTTQNQGHTTPRDHTAAHETGTTSAFRTVENEIK